MPLSAEDIRQAGCPCSRVSQVKRTPLRVETKRYLFRTLYRSRKVMSFMTEAEKVLEALSAHLLPIPLACRMNGGNRSTPTNRRRLRWQWAIIWQA